MKFSFKHITIGLLVTILAGCSTTRKEENHMQPNLKNLEINTSNNRDPVFKMNKGHNSFNQLGVKVDMNGVDDKSYFQWLDHMIAITPKIIPGATFLEKEGARETPILNTSVYYDTDSYKLLPTGALLRTSGDIYTHAFFSFKMPEDTSGNRLDRRYVFEGENKKTIQMHPYSNEAINIVKNLLKRTDIDHPGIFLKQKFDISLNELSPAIVLFDHRSTFYVLLDGHDALRCSIDRSAVFDYRKDPQAKHTQSFREVEIAIYPRISEQISRDQRVIDLINHLTGSLIKTFQKEIIYDIKYQRGAKALGLF